MLGKSTVRRLAPLVLGFLALTAVGAGPAELPESPEELVQSLGEEQLELRERAAQMLLDADKSHVVTALIHGLRSDNSEIRRESARLLGVLEAKQAIAPLIVAVGDPFSSVANSATAALEKLGEPLGSLLREALTGDDDARAALVATGDNRAILPAVNSLGSLDAVVRANARRIMQLMQGNPRAIQALCAALESSNPNERLYSARILSGIGGEAAVEPLIRALETGESELRITVIRSLKSIRDDRALEALIVALRDDADPDVRKVAASALSVFDSEQTLEPLVAALSDRVALVREAAAWSLLELGDPRSFEPLVEALDDWYSDVRRAAAWALRKLGDPRAVDPLIERLGDEVGRVRAAAADALGKMGDPRAIAPLLGLLDDPEYRVRQAALSALSALRAPLAIDPAIALLADPSEDVAEQAALLLKSMGEPVGANVRGSLAGDQDALAALAANPDPRATLPLIRALESDDRGTRRNASIALARLGHADARRALFKLAGGWNLRNRLIGMDALAETEWTGGLDAAMAVVRVLIRPASVVYLLALVVLIFGLYRVVKLWFGW